MAVSTVNGVAQANIATITGVAAANIGTVNGVTFEAQWNLDWNNVTGGTSETQNTNTETSGKTGNLYVDLSTISWGGASNNVVMYVNASPVETYNYLNTTSTESISSGDNIYFACTTAGRSLTGTVTVKEDNAAGATVDTFTITMT